jgi:hypothetical protein
MSLAVLSYDSVTQANVDVGNYFRCPYCRVYRFNSQRQIAASIPNTFNLPSTPFTILVPDHTPCGSGRTIGPLYLAAHRENGGLLKFEISVLPIPTNWWIRYR